MALITVTAGNRTFVGDSAESTFDFIVISDNQLAYLFVLIGKYQLVEFIEVFFN